MLVPAATDKKVVSHHGFLSAHLPSSTYRHLRLKPSGAMTMCVAAGSEAEERGRLHLDATSKVQVVDDASGGGGRRRAEA